MNIPESLVGTHIPPHGLRAARTRVVIAEEDAAQAVRLVEALELEGYEAFALETTEDLLRYVFEPLVLGGGREAPDLLIAGSSFHGVSGLQIVRKLRQAAPTLPVLVLADPTTVALAQRLGATATLPYAPQADRLRATVRKIITP